MSRNQNSINYRDQFEAFLRKDKLSEHVAEKFIDLLVTVVDFNIQLLADTHHKTVFEISDVDLLAKYNAILMDDLGFTNQNSANARIPEAAFLEYIEFAKTLPTIEPQLASRSPRDKADTSSPKTDAPDDTFVKARISQQNKRQELIHQAQIILQPIEEYMKEYRILSIITFEYHGTFQDVDVLSPRFKKDLNTEAEELGELVALMKKYGVPIPGSLREKAEYARDLKELKDTIRSFENWLVGYMTYLPLKNLEVNSIFFSPESGFKIGLSGKGIEPIIVRMKTSNVNT